MTPNHLISVREFCVYSQVEIRFVAQLQERGLIEIIIVEQTEYVPYEQLPRLEKFVRLHQDLAIHPDDLDVVNDLTERLEAMQQEMAILRNRLVFYESKRA